MIAMGYMMPEIRGEGLIIHDHGIELCGVIRFQQIQQIAVMGAPHIGAEHPGRIDIGSGGQFSYIEIRFI